ncbi:MAG: hypothetical protein AAGI91_17065 [Bacteroidota bacterium]
MNEQSVAASWKLAKTVDKKLQLQSADVVAVLAHVWTLHPDAQVLPLCGYAVDPEFAERTLSALHDLGFDPSVAGWGDAVAEAAARIDSELLTLRVENLRATDGFDRCVLSNSENCRVMGARFEALLEAVAAFDITPAATALPVSAGTRNADARAPPPDMDAFPPLTLDDLSARRAHVKFGDLVGPSGKLDRLAFLARVVGPLRRPAARAVDGPLDQFLEALSTTFRDTPALRHFSSPASASHAQHVSRCFAGLDTFILDPALDIRAPGLEPDPSFVVGECCRYAQGSEDVKVDLVQRYLLIESFPQLQRILAGVTHQQRWAMLSDLQYGFMGSTSALLPNSLRRLDRQLDRFSHLIEDELSPPVRLSEFLRSYRAAQAAARDTPRASEPASSATDPAAGASSDATSLLKDVLLSTSFKAARTRLNALPLSDSLGFVAAVLAEIRRGEDVSAVLLQMLYTGKPLTQTDCLQRVALLAPKNAHGTFAQYVSAALASNYTGVELNADFEVPLPAGFLTQLKSGEFGKIRATWCTVLKDSILRGRFGKDTFTGCVDNALRCAEDVRSCCSIMNVVFTLAGFAPAGNDSWQALCTRCLIILESAPVASRPRMFPLIEDFMSRACDQALSRFNEAVSGPPGFHWDPVFGASSSFRSRFAEIETLLSQSAVAARAGLHVVSAFPAGQGHSSRGGGGGVGGGAGAGGAAGSGNGGGGGSAGGGAGSRRQNTQGGQGGAGDAGAGRSSKRARTMRAGYAIINSARVDVLATHREGDVVADDGVSIVRAGSGGVHVQNKAQLRRLLGQDKCLPVVGSGRREADGRFLCCPCPNEPGHQSATSAAHTRPSGVDHRDVRALDHFVRFQQ